MKKLGLAILVVLAFIGLATLIYVSVGVALYAFGLHPVGPLTPYIPSTRIIT